MNKYAITYINKYSSYKFINFYKTNKMIIKVYLIYFGHIFIVVVELKTSMRGSYEYIYKNLD